MFERRLRMAPFRRRIARFFSVLDPLHLHSDWFLVEPIDPEADRCHPIHGRTRSWSRTWRTTCNPVIRYQLGDSVVISDLITAIINPNARRWTSVGKSGIDEGHHIGEASCRPWASRSAEDRAVVHAEWPVVTVNGPGPIVGQDYDKIVVGWTEGTTGPRTMDRALRAHRLQRLLPVAHRACGSSVAQAGDQRP